MLTSVSVSAITSVGLELAIASGLLSLVAVGLLIGKELSVSVDTFDDRVRDSLNAALVPVLFAFLTLVAVQLA